MNSGGISKQDGFTFTELMIGVGIFGVLSVSVFSVILMLMDHANVRSQMRVRDELQLVMRREITAQLALQATINRNPQLKSCIEGTGLPCLSNSFYGLSLYGSNGGLIAGSGSDAAPEKKPVFYSTRGSICPDISKPDKHCPFAATARFRVQGYPADCAACVPLVPIPKMVPGTRSELLEIRFDIEYFVTGTGMQLQNVENSVMFDLGDPF